ncbi:MAG: ATP-binding protein [Anaerolineaceae bacterium]|jgi:serine/threonine-protein kinase RsbW
MPTLTFPGRYDSLNKIASFVRQAAQEAHLNDFASYEVETAIDEACSNIIEHAYGGEDLGTIECSYLVSEDHLTIVLRDHGKPFDPSKIPTPDLRRPLGSRKAHGLGLYIMRQWMDRVEFDTTNDTNILTMTKYNKVKA